MFFTLHSIPECCHPLLLDFSKKNLLSTVTKSSKKNTLKTAQDKFLVHKFITANLIIIHFLQSTSSEKITVPSHICENN
jgi:hypothetical protein